LANSNTLIKEATTFLHNNDDKPRRQQFEQQNDDGLAQLRLEVAATTLLNRGPDSSRQVTSKQWRASAMNSSFYFRALIFDENKGLIVIGTFYFDGALIS
jgi:hypothetical protein